MADNSQPRWRVARCTDCLFADFMPHAYVFVTCEHGVERILFRFFSMQSCKNSLLDCMASGIIEDEEAVQIYIGAGSLGIPEILPNRLKRL